VATVGPCARSQYAKPPREVEIEDDGQLLDRRQGAGETGRADDARFAPRTGRPASCVRGWWTMKVTERSCPVPRGSGAITMTVGMVTFEREDRRRVRRSPGRAEPRASREPR